MIRKIGLGGGCHWCTEAVFASLKGVMKAAQGWIASQSPHDVFSEAVVVTYDDDMIDIKDLIEIHLHTHASTSNHSMRNKYRSAIYYFEERDKDIIKIILTELQPDFEKPIITQIFPFVSFQLSLPEHQNYYYSNPGKPFCHLYIHPKLQLLKEKFANLTHVAEKRR